VRYEYLDGFDVKDDNRKYTIDGWSMTLDLKLYPMRFFDDQLPPLARRFQPFATLGFGILKLDSSGQLDDWDFAARYGGGLDFYVTRNFGISTDVTVVDPMSDSLEDGEYLSFGWGVFYLY